MVVLRVNNPPACGYTASGGILCSESHEKTELDGTKTTYTYDGLGQLLTERASKGDGTANTWVYTYDSRNNRASMVTSGAENLRVDYAYDKANRLVTAMGTPAGCAAETTTYTYDHKELRKIRGQCVGEVKRSNGRISLANTVSSQHD